MHLLLQWENGKWVTQGKHEFVCCMDKFAVGKCFRFKAVTVQVKGSHTTQRDWSFFIVWVE